MESHLLRCFFATMIICLCGSFQIYNMTVVNNVYNIALIWFGSPPDFPHKWGLVVSAVWVGSIFSGVVSAFLIDKWGRKWFIASGCLAYLIGGCLVALVYPTRSISLVIIGRFLTGIGYGLSSNVSFLWIGELSPLTSRGFFASFPTLFLGLGDVTGVLIPIPELLGSSTGWVAALVFGNAVAFLLLPAILYFPDSPRFLFFHEGLSNRTLKAIEFYHGAKNLHSLLQEMESEEKSQITKLSLCNIFSDGRFGNALILCTLLLGFANITGVCYVLEYSTQMSQEAGLQLVWAVRTTVLIAVTKFAGSFVLPWLLSRFNRKPLIQIGFYCNAICNFFLTLIFGFFPTNTFSGISTVIVMVVHVQSFNLLFSSSSTAAVEVCTQEIRSVCLIFGRIIGSVVAAIISYIFLPLGDAVGFWPVTAFCGITTVAVAIYLYVKLPETKDNTFHEIAEILSSSSMSLR